MKRRTKGEGSIFQRKDGRWVATLTIDGHEKSHYGRTQAEAVAKRDRTKQYLADGLTLDDNMTVATWLEYWLSEILTDTNLSPAAIKNHRWAVDKHIVPVIGHHRLMFLQPEHVAKLIKSKKHLATSSRSHMLGTLRKALRVAQQWNKVRYNVAEVIDSPPVVYKEGRSLTPEQSQAFLVFARSHHLYPMVVTSLMLGARPGEVRALKWDDVDLEAGTLRIDEQMDTKNQPTETKTTQSRRTLNLPEVVLDALRKHKIAQARAQLKRKNWNDEGYVFTTRAGAPYDAANYRRKFRNLTTAAGLGAWNPYEMRHSAASLLDHLGVSRAEIADLLGHRDTVMLERVYRHRVADVIKIANHDRMFG